MLAHTVKCHCDGAAGGCLSRLGFSIRDMLELIRYWGFALMAWTLICQCKCKRSLNHISPGHESDHYSFVCNFSGLPYKSEARTNHIN